VQVAGFGGDGWNVVAGNLGWEHEIAKG